MHPHAKLVAVQEVTSTLLRVQSADEAFELLSMSSRCVSDLVRLLNHRDDLPSWDLHLIVRCFVPLPPASESDLEAWYEATQRRGTRCSGDR